MMKLILMTISLTAVFSTKVEIDLSKFFWSKWGSYVPESTKIFKNIFNESGVFHGENEIMARSSFGYCTFTGEKELEKIFYVHGGIGEGTTYHNDIWMFNISLMQWAFIGGNTTAGVYSKYVNKYEYQGGIGKHSMNCITVKQERYLLIIGGSGYTDSAFGSLSSIWSYSLSSGKYKFLNGSYSKSVSHLYGPRFAWGQSKMGSASVLSSIYYDDDRSLSVIFEGYSIFLFNVSTGEYAVELYGDSLYYTEEEKKVYSENTQIGFCSGFVIWKISDTEFSTYVLYMLFAYSLKYHQWKYLSGTSSDLYNTVDYGPQGYKLNHTNNIYPNPREQYTATFHNGMGYIFGGRNTYLRNDLLLYDYNNNEWYHLYGSAMFNRHNEFDSYEYSTKNIIGGNWKGGIGKFINEKGELQLLHFGGISTSNIYSNRVAFMKARYFCFGFLETDYDNVCSSHGTCQDYNNKCVCDDAFYGNKCSFSKCNSILSNDTRNVCNKKGLCVNSKCVCIPQFDGEFCEMPYCNGISSNSSKVCSSRGKCGNNNVCINCEVGWKGDFCADRNIFFLIVDFYYIFLSALVVSFLLICVIIVFVFISVRIIVKQKKTLKKLDGIDLDIILEEKRLEKSSINVANLKINKKLFEIDFDKEIVVKSRIKSSSPSSCDIFLVEWKGQVSCVFKSFNKQVEVLLGTQDSFEEFEREVEILASVSHPNILTFFGACLSQKRVGILLEYASEGECLDFFKTFNKKNGFKFPINEKIRILKEICNGMNHLHSLNIIHRDLKPENVLIMGKTLTAKIMDFGLSKIVKKKDKTMTKRVGTSFYISPEVFLGSKYDSKCDVFSFGILIYTLVTEKRNPYINSKETTVEIKVSEDPNFRPIIKKNEFESVNQKIVELMKRCWDHVPSVRPTFKDVINFLDKINYGNEKEMKNVDDLIKERKREIENLENRIKELKKNLNN